MVAPGDEYNARADAGLASTGQLPDSKWLRQQEENNEVTPGEPRCQAAHGGLGTVAGDRAPPLSCRLRALAREPRTGSSRGLARLGGLPPLQLPPAGLSLGKGGKVSSCLIGQNDGDTCSSQTGTWQLQGMTWEGASFQTRMAAETRM